ncbi:MULTISPECIES: hypothetical protein [unclassified Streptomyces]|uniref:hypothetical protein n=1 Tax=unclassified Streptomyces TaxID=2593676 RepID=UPI0033E29577
MPAPPLTQDAGPPTPPGGSPRIAYAPREPGAPAPGTGVPRGREGAEGGAHGVRRAGAGSGDGAGEVVRWAAFSCVLVPVVLVVYGSSFAGAAGWALGLTAVTAACRLLLRHSERTAEAARAARPAPRPGSGRHRDGRANGESSPLD